jgi:hypothetical protein
MLKHCHLDVAVVQRRHDLGSHSRRKNERAMGYLKILNFMTHLTPFFQLLDAAGGQSAGWFPSNTKGVLSPSGDLQ